MKHTLAIELRLKKCEDSSKYSSYPCTVQEDVLVVRNKLAKLEPFVEFQSRLAHVLNKIVNIVPDGPGANERTEFLTKIFSFINLLQRNSDKFSNIVQSPQFVTGNVSTIPKPVRRFSAFQDMMSQNVTYDQPKPILPSK